MKDTGIEKSKVVKLVDYIEYEPKSVVGKNIFDKITGNINLLAFDAGQELEEKIIPFDIFVQLIDGSAEIIIDNLSLFLNTGESIIIPAHTKNKLKAVERFKIILTVIKSGYE